MRAFLKGFVWAGQGIWAAAREERNFRFHLCLAVYVYIFSLFFALSAAEYAILTVMIVLVLAAELFNSAIERVVNKLSPQYNEHAKAVKDMAAGAVLVLCIGAVVCGFLLFWDTAVFSGIFSWFIARPWLIALLVISLAFCVWFIFGFGRKKDKY